MSFFGYCYFGSLVWFTILTENASTKIIMSKGPRLLLIKIDAYFHFVFYIVHSIWDYNCCCHILSCCDACSCWFTGIHNVAGMFFEANLVQHFDWVYMLNGSRTCHPATYIIYLQNIFYQEFLLHWFFSPRISS